jgi:hypothetical protein
MLLNAKFCRENVAMLPLELDETLPSTRAGRLEKPYEKVFAPFETIQSAGILARLCIQLLHFWQGFASRYRIAR